VPGCDWAAGIKTDSPVTIKVPVIREIPRGFNLAEVVFVIVITCFF
jgi:hypothetical protein